ncbi:MAG TPA: peptidoglycan editing factor PgeF [Candidatus Nanopelagicaceae bacterium]
MVSTRFTDRSGGVSKPPYGSFNLASHVGDDGESVRLNRELLTDAVGPTAFMSQVHGDTVVVVDGIPAVEPIADALVTQQSGIALAVLVADCIPLLLWDEMSACIGAVHVGRRGLVNGITDKVLALMEAMGATSIRAHLGPSICGRCYEVGSDVYQEVGDQYSAARSKTSDGALALDLPTALAGELTNRGVHTSQSHLCTVENADYFSYRRDGITGRQAGVIWL